MVEIIDCGCSTVQFDSIKVGDFFFHCDDLYIKTNSMISEADVKRGNNSLHFNSLRLKDGSHVYMFNDNRVQKVDLRIQCFHNIT